MLKYIMPGWHEPASDALYKFMATQNKKSMPEFKKAVTKADVHATNFKQCLLDAGYKVTEDTGYTFLSMDMIYYDAGITSKLRCITLAIKQLEGDNKPTNMAIDMEHSYHFIYDAKEKTIVKEGIHPFDEPDKDNHNCEHCGTSGDCDIETYINTGEIRGDVKEMVTQMYHLMFQREITSPFGAILIERNNKWEAVGCAGHHVLNKNEFLKKIIGND